MKNCYIILGESTQFKYTKQGIKDVLNRDMDKDVHIYYCGNLPTDINELNPTSTNNVLVQNINLAKSLINLENILRDKYNKIGEYSKIYFIYFSSILDLDDPEPTTLFRLISNICIDDMFLENMTVENRRIIHKYLFNNVYDYRYLDYKGMNITPETKVFLIPSVINTKRSLYSPQERYLQTLEQIRSIKKYESKAFIILLEMSDLNIEHLYELSQYTDIICLFWKDDIGKKLAFSHPNKNLTEVYVIKEILNDLIKYYTFSHLVKFGGRYKLTERYNDRIYSSNIGVKVNPANTTYNNVTVVESILYTVPFSQIGIYLIMLNKMLEIMSMNLSEDNERLLYTLIKINSLPYTNLPLLGIQGFGAAETCYKDI